MARSARHIRMRFSSVIEAQGNSDVHKIMFFRETLSSARERALEDINRDDTQLSEDDSILDCIADERWLLDIAVALGEQLSVVALYRTIEHRTAQILFRKYGPRSAKKASRIGELHSFLRTKGIVLQDLPHFQAIDELRLLNNAIKHNNACVTADLAERHRGLQRGIPLERLDRDFDRLAPQVPKYLRRLTEAVGLEFADIEARHRPNQRVHRS